MPAKSPEEICRLFQQYMAEGDIDSVLSVYDPEAVFLNQSGEVKKGEEELRQAHQMEDILSPGNVRVCDRGRPPSAGQYVALAHRRSLYHRQTGWRLKPLANNGLDRSRHSQGQR